MSLRKINCLIMAAASFAALGCNQEKKASPKKISIVCTTFPQYDWTREIIKGNEEKFSLSLVMDKGTDLHNFQPSAEDIVNIASSDLFIYNGGDSDEWVNDVLRESSGKKKTVLSLVEALGPNVRMEEETEGMEHNHEDEDDEEEVDEHVWLSLRNAAVLAEAICGKIEAFDPESTGLYRKNCDSYKARLSALDKDFQDFFAKCTTKTLVFADRFPFRYFVEDYGLEYFAAFSGCSAESEASFGTIIFLAEKTDNLGLPCIFTIENGSRKIAESVVAATKSRSAGIKVLDSMQSVTQSDVDGGATYLGIMEKNLSTLKSSI